MLERHYKLLSEIVRNYIKIAEPVSSKALEASLGVSSATIRNDMAFLEEAGYLTQPHTSAGRLPTTKGFQFYLDNLMRVRPPQIAEQRTLRQIIEKQSEAEVASKELARSLATLSAEAALAAISPDHTYYTGLANLFRQPEFADIEMIQEMGQIVDHLDEGLRQLWPQASEEVKVLLGDNNPLGSDCALIYVSLRLAHQPVLLGLLGPVRMDYDANIGRMNYVRELVIN